MVINNLDTFVIPLASSYRDRTWALAAGWGDTLTPQGAPNQLQSLWTEVMNHQECVQRLDPHNVNEAKLCTFRQTGKGICQGDSGGPLAQDRQLIGVASWVIGRCATGWPDGWESIAYHRSWILSKM
jgi:trypsin